MLSSLRAPVTILAQPVRGLHNHIVPHPTSVGDDGGRQLSCHISGDAASGATPIRIAEGVQAKRECSAPSPLLRSSRRAPVFMADGAGVSPGIAERMAACHARVDLASEPTPAWVPEADATHGARPAKREYSAPSPLLRSSGESDPARHQCWWMTMHRVAFHFSDWEHDAYCHEKSTFKETPQRATLAFVMHPPASAAAVVP